MTLTGHYTPTGWVEPITLGAIVPPMERLQVGQVVRPSPPDWHDVIDFPAKLGDPSVVFSADCCTADVFHGTGSNGYEG